MKIGSIELGERPVFLAPMEDVTDPAFRLMCKRFGADMVYTEFVSADALIRSVNKTQQKLAVSDEERPVAIQIYGRDVATMVEAARLCEEAKPDLIDLNFGCPVKRVAGKGAGAGMLRNIPLMLEITRAVVDAVRLPVTVKTRLGWDADNRIIVTLAEQLQDCGIAALSIHGRTRAQMYTGDLRMVSEHPEATGHAERRAAGRTTRHPAHPPPPCRHAAFQGNSGFQTDARRHAPGRNGGRTVPHHGRYTEPLCRRFAAEPIKKAAERIDNDCRAVWQPISPHSKLNKPERTIRAVPTACRSPYIGPVSCRHPAECSGWWPSSRSSPVLPFPAYRPNAP